jgi:vitamin B12 transporter
MRLERKQAARAAAAWLLWSATPLAAEPLRIAPATELSMDTIVVTPGRREAPVVETAPAVTVITREEIERKQAVTVLDVLRDVPGVTVVESGSRGSTSTVLVRGADSDQVLVLIDGVEVNSTTLGSFDFANLTVDNVERIEVLRGWGGTLYGSQAVGGVIQIFTRKGTGPFRGSVSSAGGNGFTHRHVGEISGTSGIFSYSASASHFETEGFKPENDDYRNTTVSARVDADVIERGTARVVFRVGETEFGNYFSNNFLAAPDPDARQEEDFASVRGDWSHAPIEGLGYRLGVSYARSKLAFVDRPDAVETSFTDSEILSEMFTFDGQADLAWLDGRAETIVGMEFDIREADVDSDFTDPEFGSFPSRFDESIDNLAGYALQQLSFDDRRLVLTGGVRVDDNERFGTEPSPSGGASWIVGPLVTRLRATYTEGFKAPSLNELFFPGFGNPDLDAETSRETTVGVDQSLLDGRLVLSASVFHRELDDLIESVPDPETGLFLAANVGDAEVDGAEAALDLEIVSGVRFGGQYTYLDVEGRASARVRRPRHSGVVHVALDRGDVVQAGDRVSVDFRVALVGARPDFDPAAFFEVRRNSGHQRADLAASYSHPLPDGPLARLVTFARVENLFDRDYEETLGFAARPVNVLAGFRGEF